MLPVKKNRSGNKVVFWSDDDTVICHFIVRSIATQGFYYALSSCLDCLMKFSHCRTGRDAAAAAGPRFRCCGAAAASKTMASDAAVDGQTSVTQNFAKLYIDACHRGVGSAKFCCVLILFEYTLYTALDAISR